MKNAWTEEIDRLRELCGDALLLVPLVEKLEWLKRHEDDLRSDFNEGSIEEQNKQISYITDRLRAAERGAK